MLSSRWTKQFASLNMLFNFILNELENMEQPNIKNSNHKEDDIELKTMPIDYQPSVLDSEDDMVIVPGQNFDTAQFMDRYQSKKNIKELETHMDDESVSEVCELEIKNDSNCSPATIINDFDEKQISMDDVIIDILNVDSFLNEEKENAIRFSSVHHSRQKSILHRMQSKSNMDINFVYRRDKDILSIHGNEKYIAKKLMAQRQKELSLTFAELFDLYDYLSLMENICEHIVSYEFGMEYNDQYFQHILKMTAWTEIRSKLTRMRFEWNLQNLTWKKCLQPCLLHCICMGNAQNIFKANNDECECCWAKIQFFFMGSLRFYIPMIFRYIYIILLFISTYDWYNYSAPSSSSLSNGESMHSIQPSSTVSNSTYVHDRELYYICQWILLTVLSVELLLLVYFHHFITMFKIKTLVKWGYMTTPKVVLTGLIIDDLLWCNSVPIVFSHLFKTVSALKHLNCVHVFKLSVMISCTLLQIQAEIYSNADDYYYLWTNISSFVLSVIVAVYCWQMVRSTHKYYKRIKYDNYRLLILGMVSYLYMTAIGISQITFAMFLLLVVVIYPCCICSTTTLGLASVSVWLLLLVPFNGEFLFEDDGMLDHRPMFVNFAYAIGFFMLEFETRRIARSLKWSDMKDGSRWVRGGLCINCMWRFLCSGCREN